MTSRPRPSGALPFYSYDLIANFGRRSPRGLTPGVENLARGQKLMSIFELVDFERDRHLTVMMSDPRAISIFGRIALSYVVLPISDDSCHLVAKIRVRYPRRAPWSWMRWFLPWGDLLMMRKRFPTWSTWSGPVRANEPFLIDPRLGRRTKPSTWPSQGIPLGIRALVLVRQRRLAYN